MITHRCHARGCRKEVPPRMLMCLQHWRMVPHDLQRKVWQHYRPGQEVDKNPSDTYLEVAREAVLAVYGKELERAKLLKKPTGRIRRDRRR